MNNPHLSITQLKSIKIPLASIKIPKCRWFTIDIPLKSYTNHLSHRNQPILLVTGTAKVLWTPPEVVDVLVLP